MPENATTGKTDEKLKKVLVFGTFDGIHEGHKYFLTEAAKLGILYVSVATDVATMTLKGHMPRKSEQERKEAVENLGIAHQVFIGEKTLKTWKILKLVMPDCIVLGYDQEKLKASLEPLSKELGFTIQTIKSYKPEQFHSRLLNS